MRKLLVLFILLFTVFFSYTVIAQELGSIRKSIEYSFPEKIHKLVLDPLPTGTYSVGTGGYFPTIQNAFDKLSADGIAGEVILELIDNLYTAPSDSLGFFLNGPIPGAGPNSKVTIKPAENKNVIVEGNGSTVWAFLNTSYVTVDGVGLTGTTTLTFHTLQNTYYPWNDGIDFLHNSDHNIIQNTIFIDEDYNRGGGGIGFWNSSSSNAACDSNLIENNFIKKSGIAIYVSSWNSTVKAIGNIVRGNLIGSDTDSLFSIGIQLEKCQNTIVENNIVQNIKTTRIDVVNINIGINSYFGEGDVIRNNIIHGIKNSTSYSSVGILLSGESGNYGSGNYIYNNMVYDIQSTSAQSNSRVAGIQIWNQSSPKIYYNSVYLTGTGSNFQGSAAFYIYGGFGGSTGVDIKNNIFVNTRDESPYYASAIYDYSASNLTSDYNDLYANNYLVRIGNTNYNTLADWQATGKDLHSITEMPQFVSPDLHIDWNIFTLLDGHATPITEITTDFDNEPRNVVTPDIGADEFVYVPVEFTSFTATSNGKEVILNWSTATELNNLVFEVQRSFEGSEFATIGFIYGKGTTTERQDYTYSDKILADGKYYYRLKQIDYLGGYEYSEVVELEFRSFSSYLLEQNYPNPFNPTTTIGFGLQNKSNVKITVLNSIGEEVAVILNEEREPGFHQVEFNASNLPSGVYFYQLKAGDFIQTRKMILLK